MDKEKYIEIIKDSHEAMEEIFSKHRVPILLQVGLFGSMFMSHAVRVLPSFEAVEELLNNMVEETRKKYEEAMASISEMDKPTEDK